MKISKEKIEFIMAEKGLTTVEISKRSGLSRQSFSTIKGRGTCTPASASKIAKGLEVDLSEILEEE